MEFIVYILFSETKNSFYVGYSSNLEERIIRHNQKSKGFTGYVKDWKGDASNCNLFNKEGYPAVPFRTDNWKLSTEDVVYKIPKLTNL